MTKQELKNCIDTYGRDIYSFCRHVTGNVQEAEDLYQDTWLKVVELLETIDSTGNVKSFCLSVALRLWKNKKRKFAWRMRIAEIQTSDTEVGEEYLRENGISFEEHVLEQERDRIVRQAVAGLPERLKTIVLLYYMEELSLAQIAEIEGIPEGTVKSRLYQARKVLGKKLEVVLNEK